MLKKKIKFLINKFAELLNNYNQLSLLIILVLLLVSSTLFLFWDFLLILRFFDLLVILCICKCDLKYVKIMLKVIVIFAVFKFWKLFNKKIIYKEELLVFNILLLFAVTLFDYLMCLYFSCLFSKSSTVY